MTNATAPDTRVLRAGSGLVLGPDDSRDRFILDRAHTAGRVAVVEHMIAPGVLAAPMHRHSREDEFSFVLEGRVGAIFDGVEVFAEAGDFVFKPRGEWHTFWNAGAGPLRILEIITPGGLEELFRQIDTAGDDVAEILETAAAVYGCEIDEEETGRVIERYGLRF